MYTIMLYNYVHNKDIYNNIYTYCILRYATQSDDIV